MDPSSLPPLLRNVAEEVERARSGAVLLDPSWTLVWTSSEFEWAMDAGPEKLGVGRHLLECYLSEPWCARIAPMGDDLDGLQCEARYMVQETPGGKDRILAILREGASFLPALAGGDPRDPEQQAAVLAVAEQLVESAVPEPQPPVWSHTVDWVQGDLPPMTIRCNAFRLHDFDGSPAGTLVVYDAALPGRVLALVARGDEGMFERMARLFEPGQHAAAILFADLQLSTTLSRRLPSAAYFRLVRAITTAIDQVVVRHRGIVGKHAGDGVTAFFLADDLGSPSKAARAAIDAARDVTLAARHAAKDVAEDTGLVDPSECLINVGIHWGGHLYMGQLVTGGRLEVTALGDHVNECARIQEAAQDGQVLASKSLVEHLDEEDAGATGVDRDAVLYRVVGELPGAGDKARRDIPGLPVTAL